MGNQPGKLQQQNQAGRPKKMVHWKSAERPSPPGRPILIPLSEQQPDVVNLRWERPKLDGGSPITGYVVEHRRMGSPHWVLATPTAVPQCEVSISGLEPGWRYQFRVFATNIVGRSEASELSDPLTVTLQRNAITVPRFIDELQDMQAVEDERIEFRVRLLGQPPPEISWFKDGYEIFSSRRTKIVNDNDVSVLVIHQVALSDEGEIKCTATNRAGHVVTKAQLLVQAPPKIRLPRTYEDGLIIEADEVLRLKVGIAGQPPPSVVWLHEGEVISTNGRFEVVNSERNSLLKIDPVQRGDRGEYSVRALNRLGEDVTSFLVTVTARPNPPGRVRLNMSFGKSATLSWTSPIDDGGCKIGNYIVEYFRIGWNVWLKAATTRSLSTTLNDLIEGSEYKFRVKAENPYGLSDPSEESEVLFIPDPKRGITKPKSATKLEEDKKKPTPPRRKPLSPARPQQDASTDTRFSPPFAHKQKPEVLDTEDLHREMSYGTSDTILKMDIRKSPSQNSTEKNAAKDLTLQIEPKTPSPKTPPRSPVKLVPQMWPLASKDKSPSPRLQRPPLASAERTSVTPAASPTTSLRRKRSLSPARKAPPSPSPTRRSPSPPQNIKSTPALQRSAEPVQLDVNQQVRRFSGHSLSPAKNVPALAIAIATSASLASNIPPKNINRKNGSNGKKQNAATITNPTIEISAPIPTPPPPRPTEPPLSILPPLPPSPITTTTPETTPLSTPPVATAPSRPATISKHDDVHTSNEFMLVVFDKNSKVKDKDKQDSFELDLEDAIQPPPISISSPDLASLEFTNLHTFPLRRSVSSTELLYERAMARFYEAVELEEAEKVRKTRVSEDKLATAPTPVQSITKRKRLGSMTEAERLSFERRSELRRQSADIVQDLKTTPIKWSSRENLSNMKLLTRGSSALAPNRQDSQDTPESVDSKESEDEEEEFSDEGLLAGGTTQKSESYELGSDYTDSTATSDADSIEKFKMELAARTRSPSPKDLQTYHPRDMTAGVFTPYRAPSPEQATVVLTRPMPLPSPDFVPKPILKRPVNENVIPADTNDNSNQPKATESDNSAPNTNATATNEKLNIAKGIKSFFNRDKRTATEKNTAENEMNSAQPKGAHRSGSVSDTETKRRTKEEEERKRLEAERLMREEAHAVADHYSDLVQSVSTARKYHTPLYLDSNELKKAVAKAAQEGYGNDDDTEDNMSEQLRQRRAHSPDLQLMPPVSNKPRLSISERGQLVHVRQTASDRAVIRQQSADVPETPSESSSSAAPQFPTPAIEIELSSETTLITSTPTPTPTTTETVISETREERPDGRGRTRIVKVKRIIKKRVPSGTRSRDASTSRAPSAAGFTTAARDMSTEPATRRRVVRAGPAESKSPGPLGRRPFPAAPHASVVESADFSMVLPSKELIAHLQEIRNAEQFSEEEAHEKVRSALSYSTDLILFIVACYVYLFKDARLVLPILALMIYRQLGEALSSHIPSWLKRKKN